MWESVEMQKNVQDLYSTCRLLAHHTCTPRKQR
nr:MAG TPA: hypothetical protein [Caudoviricetes sp.]